MVILYGGLIFWGSSQTIPELVSGVSYLDRVAHLIEYGLLAFLIYRACRVTPGKWLEQHIILVVILSSVLYGASDEFHQYFVPGREMSSSDFLFDSLGSVLVTVLMSLLATKQIGGDLSHQKGNE